MTNGPTTRLFATATASLLQYDEMYKQSIEDPASFWGKVAEEFHWEQKVGLRVNCTPKCYGLELITDACTLQDPLASFVLLGCGLPSGVVLGISCALPLCRALYCRDVVCWVLFR